MPVPRIALRSMLALMLLSAASTAQSQRASQPTVITPPHPTVITPPHPTVITPPPPEPQVITHPPRPGPTPVEIVVGVIVTATGTIIIITRKPHSP